MKRLNVSRAIAASYIIIGVAIFKTFAYDFMGLLGFLIAIIGAVGIGFFESNKGKAGYDIYEMRCPGEMKDISANGYWHLERMNEEEFVLLVDVGEKHTHKYNISGENISVKRYE